MPTNCISCGMPMVEAEDHALSDVAKNYCHYCARPDGSLQSYDERLTGMTSYMMRSQHLEPEAAKVAAQKYMATFPAWKERSK